MLLETHQKLHSDSGLYRAAGSGGAGAAMAAPQFLISHASDKMSHTFYCRSKKVVEEQF